jgi:hypothetical protein
VNSSQSNNYISQHQQPQAIQTAILIPSNIITLNDLGNSFSDNVGPNASNIIHQNGYQNNHHHINNQQIYDHDEINNNYENEDEQSSNVIFLIFVSNFTNISQGGIFRKNMTLV